jgi:hypothetical protein
MCFARRSLPDSKSPLSISDVSGPGLLRLARTSREAARRKLRSLSVERQLEACLDVRPESRSDFLMLLDHPEEIVARMPETEFCVTARATGLSEAPWLLDMATREQVQACFDLDCWEGGDVSRERMSEWLQVLVEAGDETLARAVDSVDPELLALAVRSMADLAVVAKEDIPPDGWFTIDGVVYFGPHESVDPAVLRAMAMVAFNDHPARYWQLVYGILFESELECEEYALRWRTGRLADLGFPELDQAMRVYRPLRAEDAPVWEAGVPSAALIPVQRLPRQLAGTLLGEALSKLPPQRAADILGYVLGVANSVAVADRLPLSASESIPKGVEKAIRAIDRGLRELARVRGQAPHDVLDTTVPLDLFRIGNTLS